MLKMSRLTGDFTIALTEDQYTSTEIKSLTLNGEQISQILSSMGIAGYDNLKTCDKCDDTFVIKDETEFNSCEDCGDLICPDCSKIEFVEWEKLKLSDPEMYSGVDEYGNLIMFCNKCMKR